MPSVPDLLSEIERFLRLLLSRGRLAGEEAEVAQALADEIETVLDGMGHTGPDDGPDDAPT
jgi:hypothetical protein